MGCPSGQASATAAVLRIAADLRQRPGGQPRPIPEDARLFDHLVGEGEQFGRPRRRTTPLNGGVGAVMTAGPGCGLAIL